jgi:hypothetical protein
VIDIINIAMDGTEKSYKVPANTSSVAFHANGGAIKMRKVSGDDTKNWTFKDGDKESIDTRTIQCEQFYFVGSAPAILEIRVFSGVLS